MADDDKPKQDRGFFLCDFGDVPLKSDMGSMVAPIFALSHKADREKRRFEFNGGYVEISSTPEGRATIYDKEILVYCMSQLMYAKNKGKPFGRTIHFAIADFARVVGRNASGSSYKEVHAALQRLSGTRITTNVNSGKRTYAKGFGIIQGWDIVGKEDEGHTGNVSVTLSEWLYQAVVTKRVLTLHPDYFSLSPLKKRVYEIARKRCASHPAGTAWRISLADLHARSGLLADKARFKRDLKKMIEEVGAEGLPDCWISLEPKNKEAGIPEDTVRFISKGTAGPRETRADLAGYPMPENVLNRVRLMVPGCDVYALQESWASWVSTLPEPPEDPPAAFLGWVRANKRRAEAP